LCPLVDALGAQDTYGECLEKLAVGLAAGYVKYSAIWAPAVVGAGLVAVGGPWLALSSPTRVTPSSDVATARGNDRALGADIASLPRPFVLPVVRVTF
jgi:hypothetical protein